MAKYRKKCFVLGSFSDEETFCNLEHHAKNVLEHTSNSETLAYKIQTPGNYPEESTHYSEHGKI
jgi:hypothetical protein